MFGGKASWTAAGEPRVSTPVSCIVYDLDGTLVDSIADIGAAVNRVREHYGLPPLEERLLRAFVGDGVARLIERAVFGLVDDKNLRPERTLPRSGASLEEVTDRYVAIYNEDPVIDTTLADGADVALRYWRKQGTAQVVLTNKPHRVVLSILERFEILQLFDLVLGAGASNDAGVFLPRKPDPKLLDYVFEQTGAPPEETYVVGDGVPDFELAKAGGLRFVPILGGYTEPDRLLALAPDLDLAVPTFKDAYVLLRRLHGDPVP